MKTLIFYINTIHDGGAERVIIQLAKHFADLGYRSVLVTSYIDSNEYPVPNNVIRISIEETQIKCSRLKRNITRILSLRKIIREYSASAIISFMGEPNLRAIFATRFSNCKCIVSVRNDPAREYPGRIGAFFMRYVIPMADGCVFQTEDARAFFPKRFRDMSRIIFNVVDPVFFNAKWVEGNDIVCLGRLEPQKNHAMLISAFSMICNDYPSIRLKIYGIGRLYEALNDLCVTLGVEDRVDFMGLTNDSRSVLSKCKCFILSSDFEGLPNALVEALVVGVPCISTDCPCGGPKMLIKNGYNGVLVPTNDPSELSLAMRQLFDDSELARQMATNAKTASKSFHPNAVFAQWKEYIEDIIEA